MVLRRHQWPVTGTAVRCAQWAWPKGKSDAEVMRLCQALMSERVGHLANGTTPCGEQRPAKIIAILFQPEGPWRLHDVAVSVRRWS
jgi:hypothetical protein